MTSPICIYGKSLTDVRKVAHCMIHYEALCLQERASERVSERESGWESIENKEEASMLSIHTKYYTADLSVSLSGVQEEEEGECVSEGVKEGCECCILVVPSGEVMCVSV